MTHIEPISEENERLFDISEFEDKDFVLEAIFDEDEEIVVEEDVILDGYWDS